MSDTETALGELDKITRRIATLQVEKQVLRDHEDDPESQVRLEEIYSEMTSLHSALVRARQKPRSIDCSPIRLFDPYAANL